MPSQFIAPPRGGSSVGATSHISGSRIGARATAETRIDWSSPKLIDHHTIEEPFDLGFLEHCIDVILLGPNGVSQTMLVMNIAQQTYVRGHTVACHERQRHERVNAPNFRFAAAGNT